MSQSTIALQLGNITVRQLNGLFSLNDLHKAAGGEEKHQPHEFLRIEQTKALVAELSNSGDSRNYLETKRGKFGGTYACRELVIAYAAWISATFHLKVIRVFLAATTPQPAPYTIQPGDTLSEPQQIALRAMLESNVKRLPHAQQAGAMVKGWSKLKAHFGVPYRQIPSSEFTEAISIVARHVSEWEVLEAEVPHSPAQNLPCVYAAMQTATQAGAQVQQAVFEAVLAGNEQWKFGRWLLSFITDSKLAAPAVIQRVGHDEFVTSTRQLIDCINDPGFLLSNTELAGLAQACTNRLARRFAGGTGPSAA